MAVRKTDVERTHERFFFETLGCAVGHSRVEIPDIPLTGDRHVAGVRPTFHEDDPVLAEQAILAGVVDEARDKKFLLRPCLEISADRGSIIELGEPDARMRTAWPDDGRKLQLGSKLAERKTRRRHLDIYLAEAKERPSVIRIGIPRSGVNCERCVIGLMNDLLGVTGMGVIPYGD